MAPRRPRRLPRTLLTSAVVLLAASAVLAADPAVPPAPAPLPAADPAPPSAWELVREDYARFYSTRRLVRLAAVLAAGGAVANSDGDEEVRAWYLDEVRAAGSEDDGSAEAVKRLGEGEVVMPLFVVAALAAGLVPERPDPPAPATWLRRSARAYLVGAPVLYYLQQLTGGSRPGEPAGSGWEPFHGNHGISGHAFVGAVPFLVLARQSPRWPVKALAIAASTLTSLERLREDQHYPSQVVLGWILAWEATGAIAAADRSPTRPAVAPLAARDGGGLLLVWRF